MSSICAVAVLLLQNCLVTKFVYQVCNVNVCPFCVLRDILRFLQTTETAYSDVNDVLSKHMGDIMHL